MGGRLSGWTVLAASVEGASHLRNGTVCQDAHAWALVGGCLVAAVADGAGSAPLAERGSHTAAAYAVEYLAFRLEESNGTPLEPGLIADALAATRRRLQRAARHEHAPLHHFATTLSIAVAGPSRAVVGQVGDGTIVLRDGAILRCAAATEPEEYLNETTFLTSRTWEKASAIEIIDEELMSVALLTDGLGLLALDQSTGEPFAPFFEPLLDFAARDGSARDELRDFLASEKVSSRTDDDVTLLLAIRQ